MLRERNDWTQLAGGAGVCRYRLHKMREFVVQLRNHEVPMNALHDGED